MHNLDAPTLVKNTELTSKSDKKGYEIFVCDPPWFDEQKQFKIANAPKRTAEMEFDGADLNFMARVLYAEASGSYSLSDKIDRELEKAAIMNVNHFRLNRKGYPNNSYVAKNFRMVCEALGQFASVTKDNVKFGMSKQPTAGKLLKSECSDLCEAIEAVSVFLLSGPRADYQFDNFRGYRPNGQGQHIGRSRFWLSNDGAKFLSKVP